MNNKSFFVAGLVVCLFITALFFREGNLIVLSMPFLAYMLVGILKYPTGINLKVGCTLDRQSVAPLEPIGMNLLVENADSSPAVFSFQDLLSPSMQMLDGELLHSFILSPGDRIVLKYTFCVGRGIYSWNSIHAVESDPFFLFELPYDFPVSAKVQVLPDLIRLRHIPIRPRFTRHIPGSIPARLPGSGTNFFSVREYRIGDSLRRIHWRMMARFPQKIFTKEFEQDEVADIGLILDARNLNGNQFESQPLFDHAVRATASLAEFFLREGNRVGLLVFGEVMVPIFPGSGRRHLNRIYQSLARASTRRYIPLEYLNYYSSKLFPSKSLVFMISPLGYRDLPAYKRLCAVGYQVTLISPNPLEYAAKEFPSTVMTSLAYRASKIERNLHLRQLLNIGVQVVDWPVDQSLNGVIHEALSSTIGGHKRSTGR